MILLVVSQMVAAPSAPQPSRSWPMPWATAMMHTPLPAESASHTSSGTRTIWRTSSRASSSGGSSLPAGVREPARVAWRWAKSTKQRNSGSMTTPCVPGATRYRVPRAAANRAASNGRAAGPATMAATEGTATQVRDLAMVMRMLSGAAALAGGLREHGAEHRGRGRVVGQGGPADGVAGAVGPVPDVQHGPAGQGRGVQQRGQRERGLVLPERHVTRAARARADQRVGAGERLGRVLAPGHHVPAEGGRARCRYRTG